MSSAVMLEAGKPVCLAISNSSAKAKVVAVVVDETSPEAAGGVAVGDPYDEADADAAAAAEDNPDRRKAMLRWRVHKMIEAEGLTIREVLYLR